MRCSKRHRVTTLPAKNVCIVCACDGSVQHEMLGDFGQERGAQGTVSAIRSGERFQR